MATWKLDYELGCLREPAPDLVPSITEQRSWHVLARGVNEPLRSSMWIHMGNVSGRETDKSEFEFMQDDPRQDWPEMRRYWRPLRNGIVKGEYLLKVIAIDASGGSPQTLDFENEVGNTATFGTGDFWRDLYAPVGQSFDGMGGWRIMVEATSPSSTFHILGMYDVFIANNDGFGNPVPGTEVLLRWMVSIDRQFLIDAPDTAFASRFTVAAPANIKPDTAVKWAGPPVVNYIRDDTNFIYHNMFWYRATGGGSNFTDGWYEAFITEVQRAYGGDSQSSIQYLYYSTYDAVYDNSFFLGGIDSIMMKVEYVSGDNVMEVNFGDTALGEWWHCNDLNIVQIIDTVLGDYQLLSGVFDITLARNATVGAPFPYVFTPIPGSEQRRRVKFVTEYVPAELDASNPLPDLSPPFDPDYPASSFSPFVILLRTTVASETVTLPLARNDVDLAGSLGHCFTVDWGDGTVETILVHDQPATIHTYVLAGDHEVSIVGLMEGWQYDLFPAEASKLIEVRAWGTHGMRTAYHMFYGCSNMTVTATDAPDLTKVANAAGMFFGCSSMTVDLTMWQPRRLRLAAGMFQGATLVDSDVSSWALDSLEDATDMFRDAAAFDPDVSAWNVFGTLLLGGMFTGSGLSTASYDLLLNAWSQIEYLSFGRTLDVDVPYTIAVSQAGRDYLTGTVFWTMNDAGGV